MRGSLEMRSLPPRQIDGAALATLVLVAVCVLTSHALARVLEPSLPWSHGLPQPHSPSTSSAYVDTLDRKSGSQLVLRGGAVGTYVISRGVAGPMCQCARIIGGGRLGDAFPSYRLTTLQWLGSRGRSRHFNQHLHLARTASVPDLLSASGSIVSALTRSAEGNGRAASLLDPSRASACSPAPCRCRLLAESALGDAWMEEGMVLAERQDEEC